MNLDTIRRAISERPFQGFTVRTSDGRTIRVPHPDFIGVSARTIFIGKEDGDFVLVDPLHIVAIDVATLPRDDDARGREPATVR